MHLGCIGEQKHGSEGFKSIHRMIIACISYFFIDLTKSLTKTFKGKRIDFDSHYIMIEKVEQWEGLVYGPTQ